MDLDPGILAAEIEHADGRYTRLAFDEPDPGDIPTDVSFTTAMPGGFGQAQWSLLREYTPRADESILDRVRFYGIGGRLAWEGRIAQLPRQSAGVTTVAPGAVGMSSLLTDNESFQQIYCDNQPGSWEGPRIGRQAVMALAGEGAGVLTATAADDGVRWEASSPSVAVNSNVEFWYHAPAGIRITRFAWNWEYIPKTLWWTAFEPPLLYATDDDSGTAYSAYDLTRSNPPQNGSQSASSVTINPARSVMIRMRANSTATNAMPVGNRRVFYALGVYGDHAAPLHLLQALSGGGALSSRNVFGVYASDVIKDVLAAAAPLLKFDDTTIDATSFVIPQLAFLEPTTPAAVIETVTAYHADERNWAVWDNDTFYYQPWGTGRAWKVRLNDPGTDLSREGDSAERIIDGVVVAYNDQGVAKRAGPPGSGLDIESGRLQDTSAGNPVVAHHGKTTSGRIPCLTLSFPTTGDAAIELGARYLAERNAATRSGSLTVTGSIEDEVGTPWPVWAVRAGDTVEVMDRPDELPRRVVSTSFSYFGPNTPPTVRMDLDQTPHRLDAILERLGVVTQGVA